MSPSFKLLHRYFKEQLVVQHDAVCQCLSDTQCPQLQLPDSGLRAADWSAGDMLPCNSSVLQDVVVNRR